MKKIKVWYAAFAGCTFAVIASMLLVAPISIGTSLLTGCAAVQEGQDSLVVQAERLAANSYDVVDGFVTLERNQRDLLWRTDQNIKRVADKLRNEFPRALESLRATTKAYKRNRTPENKATLITWQAVINQLLAELYTAQASAVKATP